MVKPNPSNRIKFEVLLHQNWGDGEGGGEGGNTRESDIRRL